MFCDRIYKWVAQKSVSGTELGCAGGVAALDARELKLYQVHLDLGQVSGARRRAGGSI